MSDDRMPSDKLREAQNEVPPLVAARMVSDFYAEFYNVYPTSVMTSDLCACGPLQAMIGLAIKNGRLALPEPKPTDPQQATPSRTQQQ